MNGLRAEKVVALGSAMPASDLVGAAQLFMSPTEAIGSFHYSFISDFHFIAMIFAPLSEVLSRRPIYCCNTSLLHERRKKELGNRCINSTIITPFAS
ncbi:hypothetical protein I308_106141 [Cryptococcus tetragattii IND107]|uniref:Uncharacterized protein n=1 Tax=Cryptococcus tetragattii IND107 TaxID=1296105 RepID=A0ABR3BL76_9TREE